MAKQMKNNGKTAQKNSDPSLEELQLKLQEMTRMELESINKQIESLEEKHQVGIGVQLDINKITDVLKYMLNHNKSIISLKFEIWKT